MGDFSKIHAVQNVKHLILVSLKHIERQLPDDIFMRIHKQYIVNLWHIATITSTDIILSNNEEIPLSNICRQHVMDKIVNKKVLRRF
jgi:two-component system, LytTR family, response regulator